MPRNARNILFTGAPSQNERQLLAAKIGDMAGGALLDVGRLGEPRLLRADRGDHLQRPRHRDLRPDLAQVRSGRRAGGAVTPQLLEFYYKSLCSSICTPSSAMTLSRGSSSAVGGTSLAQRPIQTGAFVVRERILVVEQGADKKELDARATASARIIENRFGDHRTARREWRGQSTAPKRV